MRLHQVCVQETIDKEPVYLEGPCVICRNPVLHPGDGKKGGILSARYLYGLFFLQFSVCML
jgi:hypothetical protein